MSARRPQRHDSGQAMVETAIVLPLTVFMILGLIQLALLQQGRTMAKYAAYKAVRAGSIHNASPKVMTNAALSVLLPVVGRIKLGGAGSTSQGVETYNKTTDSTTLHVAWEAMKDNQHRDGNSLKIVDVRICNPTQQTVSGGDVDFDDPKIMNSAAGWQELDKGKLSVQVTFNYRLLIPFANMVIWNITRADQVSKQLLEVTRLGNDKDGVKGIRKTYQSITDTSDSRSNDNKIDDLGKNAKKYFLPIRANFAMRMQSNFLSKYPLPQANDCVLFFKKK